MVQASPRLRGPMQRGEILLGHMCPVPFPVRNITICLNRRISFTSNEASGLFCFVTWYLLCGFLEHVLDLVLLASSQWLRWCVLCQSHTYSTRRLPWTCVHRRGQVLKTDKDPEADRYRERFFNFYDLRLMSGAWQKLDTAPTVEMFFRLLAVCHTVIPDGPQVESCV